ncbi:hypothetical protein BKA82DRAFT_34697 [Pisolithus tinctorius]|uniref:Uncharacterized protein n=1 Tax=Pisolithus tinctorius Marx 270 TaxID=870435 RepID=A0A0C3NGE0_PISTI|nr:hypothetical protein BKA82DRAFT_34697 [Pisolithus tinctorius]KIN94805.1 hypothetical protein M404DRAFT_34697 [Pisolithus tinctorius Marx 270]
MSSELVFTHHTWAKNATAHPGQIILDAHNNQHTKAEKAVDDKQLREERAAKDQAEKEGIACLTDMELAIEATQAVLKLESMKCKADDMDVISNSEQEDVSTWNNADANEPNLVDVDEVMIPSTFKNTKLRITSSTSVGITHITTQLPPKKIRMHDPMTHNMGHIAES